MDEKPNRKTKKDGPGPRKPKAGPKTPKTPKAASGLAPGRERGTAVPASRGTKSPGLATPGSRPSRKAGEQPETAAKPAGKPVAAPVPKAHGSRNVPAGVVPVPCLRRLAGTRPL